MISYDTIIELTDWLIAEEKRAVGREARAVGDHPNQWLFRTTYFDTHYEKWIAIGAELAAFKGHRPVRRRRAGDRAKVVRREIGAVNARWLVTESMTRGQIVSSLPDKRSDC